MASFLIILKFYLISVKIHVVKKKERLCLKKGIILIE